MSRSLLLCLLVVLTGVTVSALPRPQATLTVTHRERSLQPGELVAVTMASKDALTNVTVQAFGVNARVQPLAPTPARPHGWIALIGIDLDVTPGAHVVTVSGRLAGQLVSTTETLTVVPKTFATRRLTVDPDFVNPPAKEQARIEREAVKLNALWRAGNGPAPVPALSFVAPVPQQANSAFGKRSIFNGQPKSAHGGADFPSPAGTPIASPAAGKVVLTGDLYYTGGTVVIDHGLGVVSVFAHMSRVDAKEGADVAQGEIIGLVGATGRVTGAHLHWTARVNGTRVDPLALIALFGG